MQLPSYRRFVLAGTTLAAAVSLFALPAAASAQTFEPRCTVCLSASGDVYTQDGTSALYNSTSPAQRELITPQYVTTSDYSSWTPQGYNIAPYGSPPVYVQR